MRPTPKVEVGSCLPLGPLHHVLAVLLVHQASPTLQASAVALFFVHRSPQAGLLKVVWCVVAECKCMSSASTNWNVRRCQEVNLPDPDERCRMAGKSRAKAEQRALGTTVIGVVMELVVAAAKNAAQ